MKPRLTSSKKWTTFPTEFLEQIRNVFHENFKAQSEKGRFIIEGRIYPEEVLLLAGYLENGRLKQLNVEASMTCDPKSMDATDKIFTCVDAAAAMMLEIFEAPDAEELDVPLSWKEITFDGQTLFLKHSSTNTELESLADQLLGEEFHQAEEAAQEDILFHEDDETESDDALEVADFFDVEELEEKKKGTKLH
jgi:hypothetical protein